MAYIAENQKVLEQILSYFIFNYVDQTIKKLKVEKNKSSPLLSYLLILLNFALTLEPRRSSESLYLPRLTY